MNDATRQQLLELLSEITSLPPQGLPADLHLFESGYLDSMNLASLIDLLETRLGVLVEPEDLDPSHFYSLQAIEELVDRRRR